MPKDIAGKRAWILGLTVDCPYRKPVPGCIIEQFRSIPFEEAHNVIYKLPESEVEQVFMCHKDCFAEREQGLLLTSGGAETSKDKRAKSCSHQ